MREYEKELRENELKIYRCGKEQKKEFSQFQQDFLSSVHQVHGDIQHKNSKRAFNLSGLIHFSEPNLIGDRITIDAYDHFDKDDRPSIDIDYRRGLKQYSEDRAKFYLEHFRERANQIKPQEIEDKIIRDLTDGDKKNSDIKKSASDALEFLKNSLDPNKESRILDYLKRYYREEYKIKFYKRQQLAVKSRMDNFNSHTGLNENEPEYTSVKTPSKDTKQEINKDSGSIFDRIGSLFGFGKNEAPLREITPVEFNPGPGGLPAGINPIKELEKSVQKKLEAAQKAQAEEKAKLVERKRQQHESTITRQQQNLARENQQLRSLIAYEQDQAIREEKARNEDTKTQSLSLLVDYLTVKHDHEFQKISAGNRTINFSDPEYLSLFKKLENDFINKGKNKRGSENKYEKAFDYFSEHKQRNEIFNSWLSRTFPANLPKLLREFDEKSYLDSKDQELQQQKLRNNEERELEKLEELKSQKNTILKRIKIIEDRGNPTPSDIRIISGERQKLEPLNLSINKITAEIARNKEINDQKHPASSRRFSSAPSQAPSTRAPSSQAPSSRAPSSRAPSTSTQLATDSWLAPLSNAASNAALGLAGAIQASNISNWGLGNLFGSKSQTSETVLTPPQEQPSPSPSAIKCSKLDGVRSRNALAEVPKRKVPSTQGQIPRASSMNNQSTGAQNSTRDQIPRASSMMTSPPPQNQQVAYFRVTAKGEAGVTILNEGKILKPKPLAGIENKLGIFRGSLSSQKTVFLGQNGSYYYHGKDENDHCKLSFYDFQESKSVDSRGETYSEGFLNFIKAQNANKPILIKNFVGKYDILTAKVTQDGIKFCITPLSGLNVKLPPIDEERRAYSPQDIINIYRSQESDKRQKEEEKARLRNTYPRTFGEGSGGRGGR